MKELQKWFEKGMDSIQYIHEMNVNKEELLGIYNQLQIEDEETAFLQALQQLRLKALVITADWCGDALVNLPIFMRMANEALIETRYFIRDEHLELMDQYLTNGTARSIPIIVLLDHEFNQITTWGPRADRVQELVDHQKQQLPEQSDQSYDDAFQRFVKEMKALYATDPNIWKLIKKDMLRTLEQTSVN